MFLTFWQFDWKKKKQVIIITIKHVVSFFTSFTVIRNKWLMSSDFPHACNIINIICYNRVCSCETYNKRRFFCTETCEPWSISYRTASDVRDARPPSSIWPKIRNSSRPGREVRTTWAIRICWVSDAFVQIIQVPSSSSLNFHHHEFHYDYCLPLEILGVIGLV